jgi:hypothetical protein
MIVKPKIAVRAKKNKLCPLKKYDKTPEMAARAHPKSVSPKKGKNSNYALEKTYRNPKTETYRR